MQHVSLTTDLAMAVQILLQGRLAGTEEFLLAPPSKHDNRAFEARLQWTILLGETLPRALLAHLQLPALLLGTAGGGRFLVILPDAERAVAGAEFLQRANQVLQHATGGLVQILWSSTENLGDWTVVRKRLADGLREQQTAEVSETAYFDAFTPPSGVVQAISLDFGTATTQKTTPFKLAQQAQDGNAVGQLQLDNGQLPANRPERHGDQSELAPGLDLQQPASR